MPTCSLILLLALCGVGNDIPKLLQQIDDGSREEKLAALVRLERAAIDEKLGDHQAKVINACAFLLEDDDLETAEAACEVLEWLNADVTAAMLLALQSEKGSAQGFAARVVSAVASRGRADVAQLDAAIPHLARLMDEGEMYARHQAFYAMSVLGPKAIPHMVEALDAEDYFFQVMMRGFLRHGELSIAPLSKALEDPGITTRRHAARMLFLLASHNPELLPAMETHARLPLTTAIDDKDRLACTYAIDALGRMGSHAGESLDTIVAALEKTDPPFLSIAEAVAQIGARPEHLPDLFEGVQRAVDAKVDLQQAVRSFGAAIGSVDEAGVAQVILAAEDLDLLTSKTAMYALLKLGPNAAESVPAMVRKLKAGDEMAPQVLGAIGPQAKDAIPDLIDRMQHDEWAHPRGAFMIIHYSSCSRALTSIGSPALPALLEGLDHKDPLVRVGCLVAIAEMDVNLMIPQAPLVRKLSDKHPIVRGLAIGALVKHGDTADVISALTPLLKDEDRGVARSAQRAIEDLEVRRGDK